MAKEGFLIYTGLYSSIREFLTTEQRGMLFDALHDFQESGTEPPKGSPIAMAFSIYKNQFRLDDAKHEKKAARARENGQRGGRPKFQGNETEQNPENPVGYSETQKTETVISKPNESYKEKEKGKEKDKVKEKVLESEKIEEMKSPTPISDQLNSAVTPWRYIKARKSIQAAEAIVKYTLVDTEETGEAWSLWVQANKQDIWDSRDIRALWASFEWYINNANNNAKKYAADKSKPKPPYTPEIPKMNPLKSAFD